MASKANAAISSISKDKVELRNALRTNIVEKLVEQKPESLKTPRDYSKAAQQGWEALGNPATEEAYELIMEHTGDQIEANKEKLENSLSQLNKETAKEALDRESKAIASIRDNFGSIENFNDLLKENDIKFQVKEEDGKYTVSKKGAYETDLGEITEKNKGYAKNIKDWNENAGVLNDLKIDDLNLEDAKNTIKNYSKLNVFDQDNNLDLSLDKGKELLDTLSKAHMHHIKNEDSPFNSASINKARHNIMKLIHDAERKQGKDYRRSEDLDKAIQRINTLNMLRTQNGQEKAINGLTESAKAVGKKTYEEVAPEVKTLIDTFNNRETKTDFEAVTNTVKKEDLKSITSNEDKSISIKVKDEDSESKFSKTEFMEALVNNYAILHGEDPESNDDDKKIENFRELFTDLKWNADDNTLSASLNLEDSKETEKTKKNESKFWIKLSNDEQKQILKALGYESIEKLLEALREENTEKVIKTNKETEKIN